MAEFGHIQATGKRIPTAEIAIEGIEGMRPVLTCKPATEDNPAYFNALLRRSRRGRRAQNMKARDLKKIRADDIDLISEHCVTSWAGVLDAKGKAVDFTAEDCQKLLGALPYWLLDDFRNEVANPEVFIELADPGDLEDQAGN